MIPPYTIGCIDESGGMLSEAVERLKRRARKERDALRNEGSPNIEAVMRRAAFSSTEHVYDLSPSQKDKGRE